MQDLYMVLYTSMLAPDTGPIAIPEIVRTSRANNRDLDITGLLVFDGTAFCQYLEGATASVSALMKKILMDNRHVDVRILHQGPVEPPRRFATWSMAYGLANTEPLTEWFSGTTGPAVMQAFEGLLPLVDGEPHPA